MNPLQLAPLAHLPNKTVPGAQRYSETRLREEVEWRGGFIDDLQDEVYRFDSVIVDLEKRNRKLGDRLSRSGHEKANLRSKIDKLEKEVQASKYGKDVAMKTKNKGDDPIVVDEDGGSGVTEESKGTHDEMDVELQESNQGNDVTVSTSDKGDVPVFLDDNRKEGVRKGMKRTRHEMEVGLGADEEFARYDNDWPRKQRLDGQDGGEA